MNLNELNNMLAIFERDKRLKVWHFALLMAILHLGYRQGHKTVIKVSRSKIMSLSHISTLPTYHKYFKELQDFGYIKYRPSYHPGYKSEVVILKRSEVW